MEDLTHNIMALDTFRPTNPLQQETSLAPRTAVQPGVVSTTATKPGSTIGGPGPAPVPYPEPTQRPLYPEPSIQRPLYPESIVKPPYPETGTPPTTPGTTPPGLAGISNPVPGTTAGNPYAPPSSFSPNNVVQDNLAMLLNSNSPYMRNAQQRGLEQAASRGLLNSSMAAGSAQRSAIEAANPILNQIMGLTSQREGQAHQSSENHRDRQFQAEFAQMNSQLQDWMSNNDFNRNFNGQLALMPIASAADMWSSLMNLAAEDPTVFTPDVLAGYQDFFQTGFQEYISRFFQPPTGG